eukprot:COSAG02_NODE_1155_length_14189_cov_8.424060_8_plen_74_part_00
MSSDRFCLGSAGRGMWAPVRVCACVECAAAAPVGGRCALAAARSVSRAAKGRQCFPRRARGPAPVVQAEPFTG